VLCPSCRVHTRKGFPFSLRCGQPLPGHDVSQAAPSVLYPQQGDGRALLDACTTIGRALDNRVVVSDKFASRYHARIWREASGYRLEDLDSMNGTFVNGERPHDPAPHRAAAQRGHRQQDDDQRPGDDHDRSPRGLGFGVTVGRCRARPGDRDGP
jgi:hypothetical protein